jgi:hypothetical protein
MADKKNVIIFGDIRSLPTNLLADAFKESAVAVITKPDGGEELAKIVEGLEIEKGFPHALTLRQIDRGLKQARQRSQIPSRPISRMMRGDKKRGR